MAHIEPKLAGGFRDYLPEEMIPREKLLSTIKGVFERFGFAPLDTSSVEKTEILTGGDPHFRKQVYGVSQLSAEEAEGSENELALRFDLTIPLARVVAANLSTLKKPFKRYEFGKVWRGERPQAGRYREFMQCDADIIGTSSALADAEIIALMYATLKELAVPNFVIRVNNRKILNGLSEYAGFENWKTEPVLRALDKLDKQSWDDVAKELADEKHAHISAKEIEAVKKLVLIKKTKPEDALEAVAKLMKGIAPAEEGIRELETIAAHIKDLGVPDAAWRVDLTIARGLGYYTGTIFETTLTDLPNIGSVFSGGRYDNLVERFGTSSVSAVGASVGIDRLFTALQQLKLVKAEKTPTEVLALNFDESATRDILGLTAELREAGINAEFYAGDEDNMKAQLAYAVAMEVPFVLILGANEIEKNVVVIKDMIARTQIEVKRKDLTATVKKLLGK